MKFLTTLALTLTLNVFAQPGVTPTGSPGPGNAGMDGASDPFVNASPTRSRMRQASSPKDDKSGRELNPNGTTEKIYKFETSVKKLKK